MGSKSDSAHGVNNSILCGLKFGRCCRQVTSDENEMEEEPLYDPILLKSIDWSSRRSTFKNGISPTNPGESLHMRPLCRSDYHRGYMQLLSQLTKTGEVSKEMFNKKFECMQRCSGTYYVTVLIDTKLDKVIGNATLVVEEKLIHSCSSRGRIEDVVVNSEYRGKQLGKLLVESMTLLGKLVGCYKMSLECKDDKMPFYESFGFKKDNGNNYMILRYKD